MDEPVPGSTDDRGGSRRTEVRDCLALALDVDDLVAASRLARSLAGHFRVAKIGLELYTAAGPEAIGAMIDLGYDVFCDLKLHDIPTTVARAARVVGELGVSYLFIGHDLATVAHMSHRIAVMYLGKIVELAESQELCENPLHPYTRALFAAALPSSPDEEQEEETITGEVPSALNVLPGCRFNPRCPFVMSHCSQDEPELKEVSPGHYVACYLH